MSFFVLTALLVGLVLVAAAAWQRRLDLHHQRAAIAERAEVQDRGPAPAPLQTPRIDLTRCLGCGTCVRECPESGVLALVHGQAAVVDAAACVGHGRCVTECPVEAVTLTAAVGAGDDVPVCDDDQQAVGVDGLFLVGEITARGLIRVAAAHGAAVARAIARRRGARPAAADELDVLIVGAGPGGLACSLGCVAAGLRHELIDQEAELGGTVARYPRHKLVLTDDVELPLHGRLPRREYGKEELITLWRELAARHRLPFRGGVTFDHVARRPDGGFIVHTDRGTQRAQHVVLAVGRRGTPRRLGVPGEQLPHVAYALLDAASHRGEHIVVVGGGDSAVEAALALAEQPGNTVTLVHRRPAFARLRRKNRERLDAALAAGRLATSTGMAVAAIEPGEVALVASHAAGTGATAGDGGAGGTAVLLRQRADRVFVMIGGEAPLERLRQSGVSFDASLRPAAEPARDLGGFVLAALSLLLALATTGFVLWHRHYYALGAAARAADPQHAWLRPDRALGLGFGIAATTAVLVNLAYVVRRQQWWGVRRGALARWMQVHVIAGVVAVRAAMLHAAMAPRATAGGYAFWTLVVLLGTGAVGRWFYAWLPRATNGRELALANVRAAWLAASGEPGDGGFVARSRREALALAERRQWHSTWGGRVLAMVGMRCDLWRTLRRLRRAARHGGVAGAELHTALAEVRQLHALAVAVGHLEDLRAVLSVWRWLHRWVAALMGLLLLAHVVLALLHGSMFGGGR